MPIKRSGLAALAALAASFSLTACDLVNKGETPAPTPPEAPATAAPLQLLLFVKREGCAPSAVTEPVVQAYAAEHAARVEVRRIYLEDSPEMFERYGVRDTPTMVFLRSASNLEVVDTSIGAAVSVASVERVVAAAEAAAQAPSPVQSLVQPAPAAQAPRPSSP